MNNETRNTVCFAAAAVVCVALAASVSTDGTPSGDRDSKLGKSFFQDFNSTNARSLEVVVFNEGESQSSRFLVRQDPTTELFVIPSHHDYPADAEDRLAQTAASLNGIKRSYLAERGAMGKEAYHEKFGVLDPAEANAYEKGLGRRVTLKDAEGATLADYIIGNKAEVAGGEDTTDRYYVRDPEEDEVYIAECKMDLSAKFSDWIEPDLLKVTGDDITHLTIDDYSFDEQQRAAVDRTVHTLSRKDFSDKWKLDGLEDETKEVDADKLSGLVSSLDDLKIAGVRPKPAGLLPDLTLDPEIVKSQVQVIQISQSLVSSGFFPMADKPDSPPRLYANAGELHAATKKGIVYTLLFGEVFTGSELEIQTGLEGEDSDDKDKKADEKKASEKKSDDKNADKKMKDDSGDSGDIKTHRYLFVRTRSRF
ncbi:MAG: hypothetical protein CM1200mP2_07840 [Planctomycetaceae bacterium]|nr:MAG: hypothetical protein CM1200mP2_07840 [Planctomycetaceae bacterium]